MHGVLRVQPRSPVISSSALLLGYCRSKISSLQKELVVGGGHLFALGAAHPSYSFALHSAHQSSSSQPLSLTSSLASPLSPSFPSVIDLRRAIQGAKAFASMGSLAEVSEQLEYPSVKRDNSIVEDYHGVPVADPYRW